MPHTVRQTSTAHAAPQRKDGEWLQRYMDQTEEMVGEYRLARQDYKARYLYLYLYIYIYIYVDVCMYVFIYLCMYV